MSYQITYTSNSSRKRKIKYIKISPAISISISLVILLLIGYFTYSNDTSHAKRMLFPWQEQSTAIAIDNLEASIKNGIPVFDAVTAFCDEIIANASY